MQPVTDMDPLALALVLNERTSVPFRVATSLLGTSTVEAVTFSTTPSAVTRGIVLFSDVRMYTEIVSPALASNGLPALLECAQKSLLGALRSGVMLGETEIDDVLDCEIEDVGDCEIDDVDEYETDDVDD